MCFVSITELKNNLSYYLEKSMDEDVYVTKNNRIISVLVNPQMKALLDAESIASELEIDKSIEMSDEEILSESSDCK